MTLVSDTVPSWPSCILYQAPHSRASAPACGALASFPKIYFQNGMSLFPDSVIKSCVEEYSQSVSSDMDMVMDVLHTCDKGIYNMSRYHYHTMRHFDALKIYSFGKHCEKRRNCLEQAISHFLTMFSTLYGTDFSF